MAPGPSPLPSIEELLRRRAAGEKLTRAEAGKLGGSFRGGRKPVKPDDAPPPTRRIPVASGVETEGPAPVPLPPPVDPDLCRQTASEILDTLNEAGLNSITAKAVAIEAAPADVARFKNLAGLKPGAKTTMVNTSPSWLPKLLRVAGLDPQNAPEAMAGLAAVLWGVGYVRASSSLDRLGKEREAQRERDAARAEAARADTQKSTHGPATP